MTFLSVKTLSKLVGVLFVWILVHFFDFWFGVFVYF